MLKTFQTLSLALLLVFVGCSDKKKAASCPMDKSMGAAPNKACNMQAPAMASANGFSGVVVETLNTAGYTYALVDTGKAKVWAVAPQVAVKPGDTVVVSGIMPMENYQSKTLHRTFALVYFAGSITHKGEPKLNTAAIVAHGTSGVSSVPMAKMDFSVIKRPPKGMTIAEIFAQKDNLAGKNVILAAKVVKASYGILGKNWLHVQDGSGAIGTNDLTVTTDTKSLSGQTVIIEGLLAKDKDIGAGYKYSVIIENAKVTLQK
ncbi:MAG: hypothetical protein PHC61_01200 [Chitinivibrionales bacterium]|nr:hypothetical protein [Chitinivibrionales bacterium]